MGDRHDRQVLATVNLKAIARALKAGGNINTTLREFPGLNHLFQTSTTGSPAENGQIQETFAPEALKYMGDWITRQSSR